MILLDVSNTLHFFSLFINDCLKENLRSHINLVNWTLTGGNCSSGLYLRDALGIKQLGTIQDSATGTGTPEMLITEPS